MSTTKVLFVDDEERVVVGLRRMLWRYRDVWDMRFVTSGRVALELLERESFDLIISDVRMPGLDGIALLKEVRIRNPEILRVVLSGQVDQVDSLRCSEVAHQYLAKPCDPATLRETIASSSILRRELDDPGLAVVVGGLQSLPSVPELYQQLTQELTSEDPSINRVAEIVASDIAMTAKVLQLVNSAFFSLRRTITSTSQAVSLLGTETITALVLSTELFRGAESGDSAIEQVWLRSLQVASLAKAIVLAEAGSASAAAEAFLAGVLHDCGKLVLAQIWPDRYVEFLEQGPAPEEEASAFGFDHALVGAYLLNCWGLPDEIVTAVAFHHRPVLSGSRKFSALTAVHIAGALVDQLESGGAPVFDMQYLKEASLDTHLQCWQDLADTTRATREHA